MKIMNSATAPPRRVALYGTFDVLNYGDLLFPHLARHALGPSEYQCIAVSPTAATPPWEDTIATSAMEDASRLDAILHLIGGGNIVHVHETPLQVYEKAALGRRWAYPSLWLGAALVAAGQNARLAWNAPGVPHQIPDGEAGHLRDLVLAASNYVSVRDAASARFIRPANGVTVAVVPDTALGIARVWPAAMLREHAVQAFLRRGAAVPAAWTVFHLNDRYLDGNPDVQAQAIAAICAEQHTVPVLVALGPCHGDDALANRMAAFLPDTALIVDQPVGLREIAGLIAHSSGYVGSSLHGLITALSFGRPAIAVARPHMVKFRGFLDQLGMPGRLVVSWRDARKASSSALQPLNPVELAAISRAQDAIGVHWTRIRALCNVNDTVMAAKGRQELVRWIAKGPESARNWRAFTRISDSHSDNQPSGQESGTAACNICGKAEFRAGPVSLPDQVGGGAVCLGCGATARHRAMRTVFDALRAPGQSKQSCIRLGRNRTVAAGWFDSFREANIDLTGLHLDDDKAPADVVVCIDMLELAPDPTRALRGLFAVTRPGGFLFVALRSVPGYERTLDWGFPRCDRQGEFRKFGEDAEELIRATMPEATAVVAEPVDPVTRVAVRVFLICHHAQDLRRLLESPISTRILRGLDPPPDQLGAADQPASSK